ncbi:MAG: RNA polymerase sigma factor [Bacteroidia bacterium]|nr:RNA polymerase sigma factor [Bacteroidia bacterium]
MATAPDTELIARSRTGDHTAFRMLVERYESQVAGTVIGMLGNGEEAEDVGQEVFIRFYRSIENFRGDSSLGTYLTRIAINLSLNALKKRKRKQLFGFFTGENNGPEFQVPDNGQTREHQETQELVQKALLGLEKDFRAVLVLRMIDGYSSKETAEILNLPMGTVLSRLSRAQKKLKEILENTYGYHFHEVG